MHAPVWWTTAYPLRYDGDRPRRDGSLSAALEAFQSLGIDLEQRDGEGNDLLASDADRFVEFAEQAAVQHLFDVVRPPTSTTR